MQLLQEVLAGIAILGFLVGLISVIALVIWRRHKWNSVSELLRRHFRPMPLAMLSVTGRQFPLHMRADLQLAVQSFLDHSTVHRFFGVQDQLGLGGVDFASLLDT